MYFGELSIKFDFLAYDHKEGGIIEKIKVWLGLDCLEKWKDKILDPVMLFIIRRDP